jgi:hypothetical protein
MWCRPAIDAESRLEATPEIPYFIGEIIRNTRLQGSEKSARHWLSSTISISFVLHAACAKAYRFAKHLFALPSITLIYKRTGCEIKFHGENILAIDKISQAAELWRSQWDIASGKIVHAVLTDDAAVISPGTLPNYPYSKPLNNAHLFMLLPANPRLRSFVVQILPYPGSRLGERGQQSDQKIADILRESNVQIISFSSDSDWAHCVSQINPLRIDKELPLARCDIITCCAAIFDPEDAPHRPFGGLQIVYTH